MLTAIASALLALCFDKVGSDWIYQGEDFQICISDEEGWIMIEALDITGSEVIFDHSYGESTPECALSRAEGLISLLEGTLPY